MSHTESISINFFTGSALVRNCLELLKLIVELQSNIELTLNCEIAVKSIQWDMSPWEIPLKKQTSNKIQKYNFFYRTWSELQINTVRQFCAHRKPIELAFACAHKYVLIQLAMTHY